MLVGNDRWLSYIKKASKERGEDSLPEKEFNCSRRRRRQPIVSQFSTNFPE
jgi:hypothetical protein